MKEIIYILILFGFQSCLSNDSFNANQISDNHYFNNLEYSDITCPYCGFTANEKLPDAYCLIKYNCNNCNKYIFPKYEDCCVFCSYGNHKCPSKQ